MSLSEVVAVDDVPAAQSLTSPTPRFDDHQPVRVARTSGDVARLRTVGHLWGFARRNRLLLEQSLETREVLRRVPPYGNRHHRSGEPGEPGGLATIA